MGVPIDVNDPNSHSSPRRCGTTSRVGVSADHYLARNEQRALAWSLIDAVRPHLPRREHIRLVTMLGAGDIEYVLLDLIDVCTEAAATVPRSLIEPITDWAHGYRGTTLEVTLGERISALHSAPRIAGPGAW